MIWSGSFANEQCGLKSIHADRSGAWAVKTPGREGSFHEIFATFYQLKKKEPSDLPTEAGRQDIKEVLSC